MTTRDQVSRQTRTLRYGVSIAVALVGVACGALIPGTAGGTAATVLVGIGLVGVISLIFYEVGLTEDRDRERTARRRQLDADGDAHRNGAGSHQERAGRRSGPGRLRERRRRSH